MRRRGKTGKFASLLSAPNISESSEKRVKEQEHAAFDTTKETDSIVTLFTPLISSHNFYGQVASLKEQTDVRHKHDYFAWISPEVLQHFKLRWDDMIKEAVRVGIDGDLTHKSRFYHFSVALVKYGRSNRIRSKSRPYRYERGLQHRSSLSDLHPSCTS